MTRPRLSAFRGVPPLAQGLVRDLRVRWALAEVGLAHEEDGLALFESGAIVRPAFHKSLADRMARFAENAPATDSVTDHIEFVRHYEGAKL